MDIGPRLASSSGAIGRSNGEMAWASSSANASRGGNATRPYPDEPPALSVLMRATLEARAALEDAVAASSEAAQRARSVAAALEVALQGLTAANVPPASALAAAGPDNRASLLSPREREVLALVAEGRSNKAIAEELFVSPNTVKTHVASLLSKLRADTRVQLAVIAARQAPL